jgi:mannose-6-phosphate isomerase-like protein (cupin superfamily)
MQTVSKYNSLKHYQWGTGCDSWNLVEEKKLSVKQEQMPAGTSEIKHYHKEAQQIFFILTGTATFEVEGESIVVKMGEGLHIPAGDTHKISNSTEENLEFIVCSQPSTIHDRINCE